MPPEVAETATTCEALNGSGRPCRLRAATGGRYCWAHVGLATALTIERLRSLAEDFDAIGWTELFPATDFVEWLRLELAD